MLNPIFLTEKKKSVLFPSVGTDYSDSKTSFPDQSLDMMVIFNSLILYYQICNVIELHRKSGSLISRTN